LLTIGDLIQPTRAEALLVLNRAAEANALVTQIEASLQASRSRLRDERRLVGLKARTALAIGMRGDIATLAQGAAKTPVDCAAKLAYAQALAAIGDYEHALAALLEIVRADRSFGDDIGRRTMLTVFEAMPIDSDVVRRFRRELSAALN
jgi:putative thioredoxin